MGDSWGFMLMYGLFIGNLIWFISERWHNDQQPLLQGGLLTIYHWGSQLLGVQSPSWWSRMARLRKKRVGCEREKVHLPTIQGGVQCHRSYLLNYITVWPWELLWFLSRGTSSSQSLHVSGRLRCTHGGDGGKCSLDCLIWKIGGNLLKIGDYWESYYPGQWWLWTML